MRLLVTGQQTVLGDAAAAAELFVTEGHSTVELSAVSGVLDVTRLQRDIGHKQRLQHFGEDQERGARNAAAAAEGVCVCVGGGGWMEGGREEVSVVCWVL